jgi:hypothetical protein
MKEIKLHNCDKVTLVDDEDYEYLNQFTWHLSVLGYVKTNMKINGIWKLVSLHRVILNLNDPKICTDHINHDKLDNRKSNLRSCNHTQNMKNAKPHGSSKYLGVIVFVKRNRIKDKIYSYNKIRANITANGKNKHLGYFKTEEDAAIAYDEAAKTIHGEFANLNFK